MAQVTIRNLDETTVAALKARAAAKGRSLEQELRDLLAEAARPHREQVRSIAGTIRRLTSHPVELDLEELVREDRSR